MSLHSAVPFSRREALAALGALAAKGGAGSPDQALQTTMLDHVAIAVPDAARSVAFYSRIFGHDVLKANTGERRYFKIGNAYIAIAPPARGQEARRVDHFCAGIPGFESAKVKSELDRRGVTSKEVNVGLYVTDPDGIQVQLWNAGSWSELGRTAAAEQARGAEDPVFRPLGIDHILLRASDMEKSAAFYQKLFGPVAQRSEKPSRIWFQVGKGRLGLAPVGAGPGVDHLAIAVASFDRAMTTKKLKDRGAAVEAGEAEGATMFRDLDGILVQVTAPRAAAKR